MPFAFSTFLIYIMLYTKCVKAIELIEKKNKPIFLKKEERVRPPRENPILSRKLEFIMSKKK